MALWHSGAEDATSSRTVTTGGDQSVPGDRDGGLPGDFRSGDFPVLLSRPRLGQRRRSWLGGRRDLRRGWLRSPSGDSAGGAAHLPVGPRLARLHHRHLPVGRVQHHSSEISVYYDVILLVGSQHGL